MSSPLPWGYLQRCRRAARGFSGHRIVPRSWRTDSMEGDGKTMIGAAGLVGSEGERSSSMLSITGQAAGAGPLAPGQRWSLARKHEVVLRLMRGEPVEAVSAVRRAGLAPGAL